MENTNHTNISKPNQQFVRGWSWGNVNLSNGQIEFTSADQSWFNVPYYGISNVQATNKNEIALEFNLDEDADTR
jgi:structure-specific recognition protein 1